MFGFENMKYFYYYFVGLIIKILVRVFKQRVVEVLRKLKVFGILVDEVIDILVKEQLIVFVQCVFDDEEERFFFR